MADDTLSLTQLYALARQAGFSPTAAVTAAAIAKAESGGRPGAVGDVDLQTDKWGPSVGLWQIRSLKSATGTGQPRDASRLTDPAFNAHAAYEISGGGANFDAWTVFKTGAYQQFLPAAATAASGGADATNVDAQWWNPFSWPGSPKDMLGIPLSPGEALGDVAGSVGGKVAGALWGAIQPYVTTMAFALLGIGMVGAGAYVLVKPTVTRVKTEAAQAAPLLAGPAGVGAAGAAAAV